MSTKADQSPEKKQALYRKYRPNKFKDVLGQDHIILPLQEAVKQNSIAHAYLFSGTRGTGKTSIARILANELGTSTNDLYEIDAASHTSVEDIRELNESVHTLPFDSPYKVYLLDEVHMLSKSAFNALLKTLEEPPAHVIFMLATTEEEKIPETVISRCERYSFKKPTQSILKKMIVKTAKEEGFEVDDATADLIALLGDGSFRDTLGILQKVTSFSKDTKISRDEVEKVTGAPKGELVNAFVEGIVYKKAEHGLEALSQCVEQNIDMTLFAKLVLAKLRAVLMARFVPASVKKLGETFAESDVSFITKVAGDKEAVVNSQTLIVLIDAVERIKSSYLKQLPLEVALLEIVGEVGQNS